MDVANIQEIELKYKPISTDTLTQITDSNQVYELLLKIWNKDTIGLLEEFKIIYLNRSNHVIGIYHHTKGGIAGTLADTRLIVGVALKCAASSIILAHNHPSGNLKPSEADIKLTKQVVSSCELFNIMVYDHYIISSKGYYSIIN